MLRNTDTGYGSVAIALHWVLAVVLAGLFALGWYMTEIDYYDPWYNTAFELHESIGILALLLAGLRILWAVLERAPALSPTLKPWERVGAKVGHLTLYTMMILIPVSGYFISTADGHAVSIFGLFEIPAVLPAVDGLEDTAGAVHYYLAFGAAYLVVVHMLAALKHQFVDHDGSLSRMMSSDRGSTDLSGRRG